LARFFKTAAFFLCQNGKIFMNKIFKNSLNYLLALLVIAVTFIWSNLSSSLFHFFETGAERDTVMIFFTVACLFFLSFIVFYVSHIIKLPSFVIAIFFGLAAKPLLESITSRTEVLGIVVGLGATLILFSGGLETPFSNFRKLIWKILSLSFIGLFITAFLFSWAVWILAFFLGYKVTFLTVVLLGALLASTDPAAIIPVLRRLRFKNRSTKDIIISESAVTDVTGTLMTVIFLSLAGAGAAYAGINRWYGAMFNLQSGLVLGKQLLFGIIFGLAGYFLLEFLDKLKNVHDQEYEADSAFFLFVPVIIFTIALSFGGSGYLAAFLAGLAFNITERLTETEKFFNNLVEGFFKPTIFILLGAVVDFDNLLRYAPIGILVSLVFMFVIRPVAVFASLGVFHFFGKEKITWRDLLFISFVRETGAIPAVLMLAVASLGLAGSGGLVEIGMWTILATLIIEPLLTPFVARWLKVAEPIVDISKIKFNNTPKTVLLTRGRSFIERLSEVVGWSAKRSISKVMVLLCLEDKYTPELAATIKAEAEKEFEVINAEIIKKNLPEMEFKFISRLGMLEDNIKDIASEENLVTVIFVGKKMLDYRLGEIKKLSVPFFFID
jgi:NhaP-type Na+/H+ or K+/H+ antiporter